MRITRVYLVAFIFTLEWLNKWSIPLVLSPNTMHTLCVCVCVCCLSSSLLVQRCEWQWTHLRWGGGNRDKKSAHSTLCIACKWSEQRRESRRVREADLDGSRNRALASGLNCGPVVTWPSLNLPGIPLSLSLSPVLAPLKYSLSSPSLGSSIWCRPGWVSLSLPALSPLSLSLLIWPPQALLSLLFSPLSRWPLQVTRLTLTQVLASQ